MSNMNLLKPLCFLATVSFLAAPACRLPPPVPQEDTTDGGSALCVDDPPDDLGPPAGTGGSGGGGGAGGEGGGAGGSLGGAGGDTSALGGAGGGAGGGGGTAGGGDDINRIVTPVACPGPTALVVPFPYVQPYNPDPAAIQEVDMAVASMSRADKIKQMYGTLYGNAFSTQFNDIQRSLDTPQYRGWRYRDASRGMNLGEDMAGATPNASFVNGQNVGFSTVFPVSMARGAAFDLDLEYAIGEAIGDEMQAAKETLLLAPCMNILRHPFWGRAQETYGEDPYHMGRLATAMTIGIQQHVAANAKHFMAYNIEVNREKNNSQVDEQTLREIYGRHFRMVVRDGGVSSVMAAYNKINDTKATQSKHLLTEILRDDFGFKGFVLSDWWAMPPSFKATTDPSLLKTYAVEAVQAGMDVDLPWALSYGQLENIILAKGGLTEDDISRSAKRVMEQKFRFNAKNRTGKVGLGTPITKYQKSRISCNGPHLALAETAAVKSMVLLKNDNGTLPIKPSITKIAVVGATVPYDTNNGSLDKGTGGIVNFATDVRTGDLGSSRVYHDPAKGVGPFAGMCKAAGGTPNGTACEGSPSISVTTATNNEADLAPVMAAASAADFVVVVAGLTAKDEGEEYTTAGDRLSLALDAKQKPPYQTIQNTLIAQVAALNKPMVVVLEGGSVIDMPWLTNVPAVVMAFYPGQRGGAALAKLLFGRANFSAKLPFTWAKTADQYDTWNGNGTTVFDYHVGYSWFDFRSLEPLYPFGHGLSYTTFQYKKLQVGCSEMSEGAVLPVVVNVVNTGLVAGDEIVMAWVSFPNTTARRPAKELKGFARVHLAAGEEKQITIPIRLSDLDYFQADPGGARTGKWVVETGPIQIKVGGSSTNLPLMTTVNVNGY
jgi:beta-glucosidase